MFLRFAVLTEGECLSNSFGLVTSPISSCPRDWEARKKTLFDDATFGNRESWVCACEKFRGQGQRGIICDRCGVKVGDATAMRRTRFGHIRLAGPIQHPFDHETLIRVLPVIPIAFRDDEEDQDLNILYGRLMEERSEDDLRRAVAQLLMNEWTERPLRIHGRFARSLLDFCLSDRRRADVGTFLFAMGVKPSAPSVPQVLA